MAIAHRFLGAKELGRSFRGYRMLFVYFFFVYFHFLKHNDVKAKMSNYFFKLSQMILGGIFSML